MHRWAWTSAFGTCVALTLACERETELQRRTHELEHAREEAPQVTARLEKELAGAKGDVARLEEKLGLARRGLTDDVLDKQRELQQAMRDQQLQLQGDLNQAQREAQLLSRDTAAALKQLGELPGAAPAATASGAAPGAAPPPPPTEPGQPSRATPSATPESVPSDEVLRVHGADLDAGSQQQSMPPAASPPPATTMPRAPR